MAKRRTMRRSRKQRGGDLAGNPPSAWGWGMGTLGNGWTQFMNSLTVQPGANAATAASNDIVPVKNINANNPPSQQMKGGRRRGRRTRTRRAGNFGAVLSQAAAPLLLLGAQQTYGKRRSRKGGYRKH